MEKSAKRAIMALSIIVGILVLVIIYAFAIRPAINKTINGYAIRAYNKGVGDAVQTIISRVQQSGYVQLPAGNNQSIVLAQYRPPIQPRQTTTQSSNPST